MDKVTRQSYGKTGTVSATVITTATGSKTADLTPVTWGVNGVNYSSPLTGASTSETVTLVTPATLSVGEYPVTASVGGATAAATLKVIDYPTIYNSICTTMAPSVKAAFKLTTYYVLQNNPDLADTFEISQASASAILCATDPTAAGFKVAITAAIPKISDTDAELVATALEAAYASANSVWQQQTGSSLALSAFWTDSKYATGTNLLLTNALSGVSEGITMYKSSTSTSN